MLRKFVVEGNKENTETSYNNLNTFVVRQKPTGRSMLIETKRKTQDARKRNIQYQQREEEMEKCIKKITKNWKRTYYKTSYEKEYDDKKKEWVVTNLFWEKEREFYGYDKEEDHDLRHRLRDMPLSGEKIC